MKTNDENKVKLIADVSLFIDNNVLLVRYKDSNKYDHQKGWFLPDDEIIHGEHPEDAAIRIMSEQLNIHLVDVSMHSIESFIGNDKSWHLVFHFAAFTDKAPEMSPSADVEEAKWFNIEELPDEKDIAHHGWAKFTIESIINDSSEEN